MKLTHYYMDAVYSELYISAAASRILCIMTSRFRNKMSWTSSQKKEKHKFLSKVVGNICREHKTNIIVGFSRKNKP